MSIDLAVRSNHGAPLVRRTLNGPTMGTLYSAVFFAPEGTDIDALAAALYGAVDRVDRQMSTWKAGSDLNRLNNSPVGDWVAIPRELTTVLAASLQDRTSLERFVRHWSRRSGRGLGLRLRRIYARCGSDHKTCGTGAPNHDRSPRAG